MWLQRQIALLWTNQKTGSFKAKASRSTVIANGSLATFPFSRIHNRHTHRSSKYLRSLHTLTEGHRCWGFRSRRVRVLTEPSATSPASGHPELSAPRSRLFQFRPRTNGEIVVGAPRGATRIPEVPAGIAREFAGTGSARVAAAVPGTGAER